MIQDRALWSRRCLAWPYKSTLPGKAPERFWKPGQTTYPWNTTQVWRGVRYTHVGRRFRLVGRNFTSVRTHVDDTSSCVIGLIERHQGARDLAEFLEEVVHVRLERAEPDINAFILTTAHPLREHLQCIVSTSVID
jgi:hypothetical protein